ncbi:MAG: ATP-binding protein [Candidatus Heimdallarchaeota archaeon]
MPKANNLKKSEDSFSKEESDFGDIFSDTTEMLKLTDTVFRIFKSRIALINMKNELMYTSDNSDQIIGYSFEDFQRLTTFGYIHPDDRDKVKKKLSNFRKSDFTDNIKYRIFKPSGEMRWIRGVGFKFVHSKTNEQIGTFILEFDVTEDISKTATTISEPNFYKELIDLIQTPIAFIKNFQFTWVSDNWQNFYHYRQRDINNQSLEILFPNQDEYARFLLECNNVLKKSPVLHFQTILHNKRREKSTIDITAYAIDKYNLSNGLLLFFRDVAKDLENQKKKDSRIDYYESFEDNLDLAVLHIEDSKIANLNKTAETLLQYNKSELVNQDLSILFQTKDAHRRVMSDITKNFALNKNFSSEITCLRKDRMPLLFSIRATPISYNNKSDYILQLEQLEGVKQTMNKLREEKKELEFYSDLLFHDVRNLCQDAMSQIDLSLLKMDIDPNESTNRQRKSMIEIIRIGELITNMDKYFKLQRDDYDLYLYDIFTAFKTAEEKISLKFDQRNIKFKHKLEHQTYLTNANELLVDVFFNILDNAVMFDKKEDIEIEINITESYEQKNYWRIEILDNGPGIGEKLKKFLFDRYARSQGTIHGSGFGLTLVKAIIESYNGKIFVEDRAPGTKQKGTKIIFEIPRSEM